MSKRITISVSDNVFDQIETYRGSNRSEFVEEMIRKGLAQIELVKEDDKDGRKKEDCV